MSSIPPAARFAPLSLLIPTGLRCCRELNVGDTVTAVVSQTLAVSITPAPKSWF